MNSEPTLDWEDENEDETNVTSEILERAKNQDENLVKQEIEEASEKKETIEPTPENTDFSLLSNENLNLATSDKIEKIVKNEDGNCNFSFQTENQSYLKKHDFYNLFKLMIGRNCPI